MANPYRIEFVNDLIGQQETQRLEFKSSRDLLTEDSQKRGKFISGQIVPTVSAFLNTDGGQLIIGMEEKDGVAVAFSAGVPRARFSWEQLQSAICDRIQPAVAGYVSAFPVEIGTNSDGPQVFAFVVEVKPGTTAYQADDKKYYVRRSGQSEAMEDKDVRLRMLAGDKPRLIVSLHSQIVPNTGEFSHHVQYVACILRFENVGVRNIPRAIVRSQLNLMGLTNSKLVSVWTPEYQQTDFPVEALTTTGLLPGQCFDLPLVKVSSLSFSECEDISAVTMTADVTVYIDDGLPAELRNYDLVADVMPVIKAKWIVPQNPAMGSGL